MIHCQSCTTRNPMTRQFCSRCGTRLLVASGAAPSDAPMSFMDEHVLERISAIEYALSVLGRRVDSLVEGVERIAASNFIDHAMIETLTEMIESAGVSQAHIEAAWRKRIDRSLEDADEVERLGERMDRIVRFYRGPQRKRFTQWMEHAYASLVSEKPGKSLKPLKAGFEDDPLNYELGMLLAEVCFEVGEFDRAARYLARVLESKPDYFEATLLMALLEQHHGDPGEAERLLELALKLREDSPSAHATLGSLLMARGARPNAIVHLNRALELKPTAPAHFMLGALYYQTGRQRRAIAHLRQATELDPGFGEAFYQLGLLCLEMNWRRKAQECFDRARRLAPQEARYRRKARGFSETRLHPDHLSGLVRDELQLTTFFREES